MSLYPAALCVEGKRCAVIGGGAVAERKAASLLECGACVLVVSPECTPVLKAWAGQNRIALRERNFQPGDLDGAMLAIAATDDKAVNEAVMLAGRERGVLVNVVDVPEWCDFYVPAVVRRGDLLITVNTNGQSPMLAKELRRRFNDQFGAEWASFLELLGRLRLELKARQPDRELRNRAEAEFLASPALSLLAAGRESEAEALLTLVLSKYARENDTIGAELKAAHDRTRGMGTVWLVGAGPGDPHLITVKGSRCIADADVIVYDALINPVLLDSAKPGCEILYVGKQSGRHPIEQSLINELLRTRALEGKRVCRLKGGDPFVFGRGGEEARFLHDHGIPCEVVPGVTAAIAVPAYAGIPVTYRNISVSFRVITGHEDPDKAETQLDFADIAATKGTLVFLMCVRNLRAITQKLIEAGKAPETPAAIIMNGTMPTQRTITATLATVADASERAGVTPPATLVLGEAVTLREHLHWFPEYPAE